MKILLAFALALQLLCALELSQEEKKFLKENPVIKVSNEPNWPPFDYSENNEAKGYSVDYLKLLAKKMNITFEFQTDTWPNLVGKIKNRDIDVIHPMSMNEQRKTYLNFLPAHIESTYSIITRQEVKHINSLQDFKNKRIAVVEGWNSTLVLKKHYPNMIFVPYASSKEKLEAVAFGEVDGTIEEYFTANYLIQRHLLSNLTVAFKIKDPRFKNALHIAVRKDWPIFTSIMQKAMAAVTEEDMLTLNIKWVKIQPKKSSDLSLSKEEQEYLYNKQKITMCIDPDWMPYEKNVDGKHMGMSSDYFEIFRKLITVPIEYVPTDSWTQSLEFAKERRCDIISLAVKTPLRSEYMNFTSPYLKLPLVIATKINEPFISDIKDVLDKEIAVIKGHAYIEILKIRYPKIQFLEVDSLSEGFQKVLDGEAYGFLDSLASIGYDIQRNYVGTVKIAGKLDVDLKIGVATRNDEPLLLSIFDKALTHLSDSTHRDILNKWVSVKFDNTINKDIVWQVGLFILIVSVFLAYRQHLLKRQNNILQDSNDEFEYLINSTIEALFILENNRYVQVNDEGIKLFGAKSKEELLNKTPYDLIQKEYHALIKEKLEETNSEPYEAIALKLDGSTFPVLIKAKQFSLKNNKVRVAAILDLSDLKSKEKLLLEQTKMAALGEMMGNIAHQWRQPLSVISTAASGMKLQKSYNMLDDEEFEEYNDAILTNVEYLSKTIDDFKNFVKENKHPNEFNLTEHIQKDLSIISPMLKNNNIEVVVNTDDSIMLYNLENELTQAIVNIVSNSKDAFDAVSDTSKIIFISTYRQKKSVIISIKDTAGGIDKEVINHIFEPYFTTKHKSQGTGLGPFMTRQIIVESMKGSIDVANETFEYENISYKGANFRLTL